MDAFSCPPLKQSNEKTTKNLIQIQLELDETRGNCQRLEEQLIEKEQNFTDRENKLIEINRIEILKVENCLNELERKTNEKISEIEQKNSETEDKFLENEKQLKLAKEHEFDLLNRINSLCCTENELREKVQVSEDEFNERIRSAGQRERDLTDKILHLQKQLDVVRITSEQKERELSEKLNITQDELTVTRRQSRCSPEQQKSRSPTSLSRAEVLQDEVESLRCVLELKQSEISELRKQNQEYQRAGEELPTALIKISGLESRLEDVLVQLTSKMEHEKDLLQKNKLLQENYSHEVCNKSRLLLHNEELQWKLKQNSEKFSHALTELSKSYQDQSSLESSSTSMIRSGNSDCFNMDDISPPTSPMIKGVVQKSDSVSWVLDLDDEPADVLASRVVRRAGSFRSSFNEKCTQSPVPKRQRCNSQLSQSASATSILRQQSDTTTTPTKMAASTPRARSKSVSVKTPIDTTNKKIVRSNSGNSPKKLEIPFSWNNQSICSSSPYTRRNCETVKENSKEKITEEIESENIRLITCNPTSDLCRSLPSHPSVQDLKKCQIPKESAGEAMVSGSNSEDETSSTSSDTTNSSCSINRRHMTIEEALMDKIVASLGGSTPMEVSWSEDGDQYPSESTV